MPKNEEFELARLPVPSTSQLQAAIIADAKSLPQYVDLATRLAKPEKRRHWFSWLALPLISCLVIVAVILINPDSDLNNSLVVSEELDWQEIMLLEDEWLLADL
jgi:hypothetical protein